MAGMGQKNGWTGVWKNGVLGLQQMETCSGHPIHEGVPRNRCQRWIAMDTWIQGFSLTHSCLHSGKHHFQHNNLYRYITPYTVQTMILPLNENNLQSIFYYFPTTEKYSLEVSIPSFFYLILSIRIEPMCTSHCSSHCLMVCKGGNSPHCLPSPSEVNALVWFQCWVVSKFLLPIPSF